MTFDTESTGNKDSKRKFFLLGDILFHGIKGDEKEVSDLIIRNNKRKTRIRVPSLEEIAKIALTTGTLLEKVAVRDTLIFSGGNLYASKNPIYLQNPKCLDYDEQLNLDDTQDEVIKMILQNKQLHSNACCLEKSMDHPPKNELLAEYAFHIYSESQKGLVRKGKEISKNIEQMKKDGKIISVPDKEIPFSEFGKNKLTKYLFGDYAKDFGKFLGEAYPEGNFISSLIKIMEEGGLYCPSRVGEMRRERETFLCVCVVLLLWDTCQKRKNQ